MFHDRIKNTVQIGCVPTCRPCISLQNCASSSTENREVTPGIHKPSGLCLCVNVPPPRSIQRRGLGNCGKDGKPAVSIVFSFVFPEKYLADSPAVHREPTKMVHQSGAKVLRGELRLPRIPVSHFQVTCSALICS